MENKHSYTSRFSHLAISAALSVIAIVGVVGWQINNLLQEKNANLQSVAATDTTKTNGGNAGTGIDSLSTATSSNPEEISQIGTNAIGRLVTEYAVLTQHNTYTPALGNQIIADVMPTLPTHVAYPLYSAKNIPTDTDTSRKRMLAYRADLQISLKPLMKNKKNELGTYNAYVQTRDAAHLSQLKVAAQNYRDVATSTANIVVPVDAVAYQVGILNAMQEFAATLDAMTDNADDPITSVALLSSYNQAETDMVNSFNALYAYYAQKQS